MNPPALGVSHVLKIDQNKSKETHINQKRPMSEKRHVFAYHPCSKRAVCQNRPKQIERDSHQSTEAYTIKKDLYKKKRPIQSKEAYTIRKDCSTANCIWRVIQSHSPISFELVSLLRNSISYRIGLCATERGKRNVDN